MVLIPSSTRLNQPQRCADFLPPYFFFSWIMSSVCALLRPPIEIFGSEYSHLEKHHPARYDAHDLNASFWACVADLVHDSKKRRRPLFSKPFHRRDPSHGGIWRSRLTATGWGNRQGGKFPSRDTRMHAASQNGYRPGIVVRYLHSSMLHQVGTIDQNDHREREKTFARLSEYPLDGDMPLISPRGLVSPVTYICGWIKHRRHFGDTCVYRNLCGPRVRSIGTLSEPKTNVQDRRTESRHLAVPRGCDQTARLCK